MRSHGGRIWSLVAAVAVAAPVAGFWETAPASAASVTLKWSVATGKIVESSPLVVNLDGQNDVVVGSEDRKLYAFHGSDGSAVPGWPQTTSRHDRVVSRRC